MRPLIQGANMHFVRKKYLFNGPTSPLRDPWSQVLPTSVSRKYCRWNLLLLPRAMWSSKFQQVVDLLSHPRAARKIGHDVLSFLWAVAQHCIDVCQDEDDVIIITPIHRSVCCSRLGNSHCVGCVGAVFWRCFLAKFQVNFSFSCATF